MVCMTLHESIGSSSLSNVDKYREASSLSLQSSSSENSILRHAMKSEFTFLLWLYAVASIRDCWAGGSVLTEEVQWCESTLVPTHNSH
jgi:hypothetical protein